MTKTLCSIYFSKLEPVERPLYQGKFSLPVVKRGESPAFLTIKDHYQVENLPYFAGTGNNGKPIQTRTTITGEQIAADCLAHWTAHHPEMSPQCGPGIWMVRDLIPIMGDNGVQLKDENGPVTRPATPDEKAQLFAEDLAAAQMRQDAWAEKAVTAGDIASDNPKAIAWIAQFCKDSVDYLGMERDWRKGLRAGDVKPCPVCTKSVSARALKCPHCQEIIDTEGHANFLVRQEEATSAAKARIKSGRVLPPPVANPQVAAR
jgi:hypothetical protein